LSEGFLVVQVSWGWCGLRRSEAGLRRSTLLLATRQEAAGLVAEGAAWDERDNLLHEAGRLLGQYFEGGEIDLRLPLDLRGRGTFSRDVLRACAQIPYGQTRSYGELAVMAGKPAAARAVGQVMARNPLPLFVPCHRVIGADGSLGGFGAGLEMKRRLLRLEGMVIG
jgi:methylated-DNA-[protein]-cysteine S-methyltransferase